MVVPAQVQMPDPEGNAGLAAVRKFGLDLIIDRERRGQAHDPQILDEGRLAGLAGVPAVQRPGPDAPVRNVEFLLSAGEIGHQEGRGNGRGGLLDIDRLRPGAAG